MPQGLVVFEGKSGFGFKPAKTIHASREPRELATDDFDGDKKRDLAVSRQTPATWLYCCSERRASSLRRRATRAGSGTR